MFHLKNFFRAMLNGVSDGVAVSGAQDQGLQNQQVERTLEHLACERIFGSVGHPKAVYSHRRSTEPLG
jgi:hypothetical protein